MYFIFNCKSQCTKRHWEMNSLTLCDRISLDCLYIVSFFKCTAPVISWKQCLLLQMTHFYVQVNHLRMVCFNIDYPTSCTHLYKQSSINFMQFTLCPKYAIENGDTMSCCWGTTYCMWIAWSGSIFASLKQHLNSMK